MRKIIRGRVFDTEKSSLRLWVDDGDIHFGVYQRPRAGDYFICGVGGPLTIFRGRKRCIKITSDFAEELFKLHFVNH